MTLQELIENPYTFIGALISIAWFFWQRYQQLEKRLRAIESENINQTHKLALTTQRFESQEEKLDLACNGNRELIEHRTRRFCNELERIEVRFGAELHEVKAFLDKTTDFRLRSPRNE
jgi:hypothetical protein